MSHPRCEAFFRLAKYLDLTIQYPGLFAPSHMTWDMTRNKKKEPSLTEMTSKAIELLQEKSRSKEKGFLLFVEGGRIDHGHHEGRAKVLKQQSFLVPF